MEFFALSTTATWTGALLDLLKTLAGVAGGAADLIGLL